MRTEQEILNDIKAQQDKLKELCGPSAFGIYVKYIEEYDENGNLVKATLDPEVQKCYEEIRRLEQEYRESGYHNKDGRGEYSGSSNGW